MTSKKATVLIVDDSPLFCEGLVNMFSSQTDFTIVGEARSVKEAIYQAQVTRPDIILMDIGLPDGSGVDATRKILAEQPDIRIVILTVNDESDILLTAILNGAKGYLHKEMPFSKLLSALRGLMCNEAAISRKLTKTLMDKISNLSHNGNPWETDLVNLSKREIEILRELASESSNQEIAERLSLSVPTVKHYIHKVLVNLHLKNRKEAARYARHQGLGDHNGYYK